MLPKNSGGSSKFPGGRQVIHRIAQTAFVRVVTPRVRGTGSREVQFELDNKESLTSLIAVIC